MPETSATAMVQASWKRRALAAYLDFVIFGVPWAFVHAALLRAAPVLVSAPLLAKLAGFALIEALLLRRARWSPGNALLGIRLADARYAPTPIEPGSVGTLALVPAGLLRRESPLTILLGVFLLLEGCKTIVRWTMWTPPIPLFGFTTGLAVSAAALVAIGAFECSLAVLVFRLRRRAFSLGLLYFALTAALIVSSWTLWDGWAGEMFRLRRAYQGRAVLPGEVEMLQRIMPEAMFVGPALTALGLFLARRRLDS